MLPHPTLERLTGMGLADEVARHFGITGTIDVAAPPETIRGGDGLIVREARGRCVLQSLGWGFPRQTREMRGRGDLPTRLNLTDL